MHMLAGTSRGVFALNGAGPRRVLEGRGVRDIVRIGARCFAATGAGLYLSDDDGETWRLSGMADREVWQVRAGADGVLWAGTQPAGLYRSTDMGESWTEVTSFLQVPEAEAWCVPVTPRLPGRARAIAFDRDDPRRLRVGVEVGGIMRSDDGGESWSLDMPGGNPDLHMLSSHPGAPGTMFASTGYGRFDGVAEMVEGNAGVFRSDDGGTSWRYVWSGITPRYSRPMCIDPRSPHGLTVASAPTAFSSFKDQGGAQAMLYRSDDGGGNWRSLCDAAHTPCAANIHGLVPDPERAGGVVVGTDTGEIWRVASNAEWTPVASALPAMLSLAAWAD